MIAELRSPRISSAIVGWRSIPIALAAFIVPIVGGHISMDAGLLPASTEGVLKAVLGGGSIPLIALALVAVLLSVASFLQPDRRLPRAPGQFLGAFLLVTAATLIFTPFKMDAVQSTLYFGVLGLVFATAFNAPHPRLPLAGYFAATVLLAFLGLHEYIVHARQDPNWRVFSLALNPNIAASMLGFGLFCGLSIYRGSRGYFQILIALTAVVSFLVILLTQSRGAILTFLVALVVAAVFLIIQRPPQWKTVIWLPLLAFASVALFPTVLGQLGGSAGSRVSTAQPVSVQAEAASSTQYRLQLYKGALDSMRYHPFGVGAGAYRFLGAQHVVVKPAHQAHSSFLQIGVEAGWAALVLFLLFLGTLLFRSARSIREAPDSRPDLPFLLAGCLFVLLHACVESNLHFLGVAFGLFLVLGIVMARIEGPTMSFRLLPIASLVLVVFAAYLALGEAVQARARWHYRLKNIEAMRPLNAFLASYYSWDDETHLFFSDTLESDGAKQAALERATRLAPWYGNFGLLASARLEAGDRGGAMQAVERALETSPVDSETLLLGLHALDHDQKGARDFADRLIELERQPYSLIQPVANLVYTDGASARLIMRRLFGDSAVRPEELEEAAEIFVRYVDVTLPHVRHFAQSGQSSFQEETLVKALDKTTTAAALTEELAKRSPSDSERWGPVSTRMVDALNEFRSTLWSGGKPLDPP